MRTKLVPSATSLSRLRTRDATTESNQTEKVPAPVWRINILNPAVPAGATADKLRVVQLAELDVTSVALISVFGSLRQLMSRSACPPNPSVLAAADTKMVSPGCAAYMREVNKPPNCAEVILILCEPANGETVS